MEVSITISLMKDIRKKYSVSITTKQLGFRVLTMNSQVLTPRIKLKRDTVEETWLDATSILHRLVSLDHHDPTFGT